MLAYFLGFMERVVLHRQCSAQGVTLALIVG
jgi:hypothetical protein